MLNKPLLFKLFRDLWQRRGTLLALMLVLMIGVGSYTGMMGVCYDLSTARDAYYHQYNLADFTLDLKRAPETAVATLADSPNILRLRTRIKTNIMVQLPGADDHLIAGAAVSLPTPRRNIINNIKVQNVSHHLYHISIKF